MPAAFNNNSHHLPYFSPLIRIRPDKPFTASSGAADAFSSSTSSLASSCLLCDKNKHSFQILLLGSGGYIDEMTESRFEVLVDRDEISAIACARDSDGSPYNLPFYQGRNAINYIQQVKETTMGG
jgi:hypothetical protein